MNRSALVSLALLAILSCGQALTPGLHAQDEFLPPPDVDPLSDPTGVPEVPSYANSGPVGEAPHGDCNCGYGGHYGGGYGAAYHGAPCQCGNPCCEHGGPSCFYYSPWTITAGGVMMQREAPDEFVLIFDNAINPLIRAQDLEFDFEGGFDVSIVHDHGSGICGTEFRALIMSDWEARQQATTQDPIIFTNNIGGTPVPGLQAITVDYQSEAAGFEINYRERWTHAFTVIVGFRYMDLNEDLTMTFVDAAQPVNPNTQSFFWRTDNDFFGGQIGGMMELWYTPTFQVDGTIKAGAFLNDTTTVVGFRNNFGQPETNGAADEGEAAFIGEVNLMATWSPTCNFRFRTGYQALWIDGAVLASEQVVATTANVTAGSPVPITPNAGATMFHGVFAGLEYRY